ncbi:hypothetical protein MXD81_59880 [Microbacteriaceae bacterium K1510]|nr:hypothetical protein [Microbacteriaceae bacterium K1510]
MRALIPALALSMSMSAACAANEPPKKIDIPDAASLIGKTLDDETQFASGTDAPRVTAEDWSYGFAFDDPGLQRTASTRDRGKGGGLISMAEIYDRRCDRAAKTMRFAFGSDERFPLKGTVAKGRYADGWVFFGDALSFEGTPAKIKMELSENDGALYVALDRARMLQSRQVALCPTVTAAPGKGGRCAMFSLAGFARAFDFVCEAK